MKDEPSLISMHPFIRTFVLNIVRTIKEKKFEGEKFVIDADMVPRVSSHVMRASMGAGIVRPKVEEKEKPVVVRRDMSELIAPIEMPPRRIIPNVKPRTVSPNITPPVKINQPAPVVASEHVEVGGPVVAEKGYGKIIPLLDDPSISTIECQGRGKKLMVMRAGRMQPTRIVLGDEEIHNILEKAADDAHIPLIEGIFRVNLPKFSISAVISKMVGSRFVLKRTAAYNLLK